MSHQPYLETAAYFCVEDLPGSHVPSARLQRILAELKAGRPISRLAGEFLQKQGLLALHGYAQGTLTYEAFRPLASAEKSDRMRDADAKHRAAEAERLAREAAMEEKLKRAAEQAEVERLARERDPRYIAKMKNRELRSSFGLDMFVEETCFGRLMGILKSLDAGERLSPDDVVWLSSTGQAYFTDEVRTAYHRLEADFFAREFEKTRDPWLAVNASSHYRKIHRPNQAKALLSTIDIDRQSSPKLKSALNTTLGGVMRDLRCLDEALHLGEKAHELAPADYRPCTLLGAVNIQLGNCVLGTDWYAKAVERGATKKAVDQEIRSIFFQLDKTKQAELRAFLMREDPKRYAWVASK